jgi:hypothetical protein
MLILILLALLALFVLISIPSKRDSVNPEDIVGNAGTLPTPVPAAVS